jgi:hypothetical protein
MAVRQLGAEVVRSSVAMPKDGCSAELTGDRCSAPPGDYSEQAGSVADDCSVVRPVRDRSGSDFPRGGCFEPAAVDSGVAGSVAVGSAADDRSVRAASAGADSALAGSAAVGSAADDSVA